MTQPAPETIDTEATVARIQDVLLGFLPGAAEAGRRASIEQLFRRFAAGVVGGTLQFLLAILLSFLIVLDFDRITDELMKWRESPVGRFFQEHPLLPVGER